LRLFWTEKDNLRLFRTDDKPVSQTKNGTASKTQATRRDRGYRRKITANPAQANPKTVLCQLAQPAATAKQAQTAPYNPKNKPAEEVVYKELFTTTNRKN
jgi:hypothetical protein